MSKHTPSGIIAFAERENPKSEANARLIAAAPELLEAAKAYTKDGECYCPDDFKNHEPCGYCKLISAISKAQDKK